MTHSAAAFASYLDDLARMLEPADPTVRADVLGGVREHLDARLAELGHEATDADVAAILGGLGAPEQVAREAFEGGWAPSSAGPAGLPAMPLAPAVPAPRRALDAPWVPWLVLVLAVVGILGSFLLLPVVLWVASACLLGISSLWRSSEKVAGIIGGLVGSIAGAMIVTTAYFTVSCSSVGGQGMATDSSCVADAQGGAATLLVVLSVVLALILVAAIVQQVVLCRRALARAV